MAKENLREKIIWHLDGSKPERNCGGCTACCKTHYVAELKKMPGTWCEHCVIGKGCKIYGEHPAGCKSFQCQWLMGTGLEEHRPDRSKIVIDYVTLAPGMKVVEFYEAAEGALDKEFAETMRRIFNDRNWCVAYVPLHGKHTLYIPIGAAYDETVLDKFRAEGGIIAMVI